MRHFSILRFLAAAPLLAYSALFAGMIIEGDLFIFTAGFLVSRGVLNGWLSFLTIFTGVILGDSLWFLLGRVNTTRNKFLRWLGRMTDVAGGRIDSHVKERTFRTLLISKFVYGAHHFTLVRAGRLGVPFRRFWQNDVLGSLIWIGIVGTLGYLAGASFEGGRGHLRFIELGLLFCVLAYFLISEIVSRLLQEKL